MEYRELTNKEWELIEVLRNYRKGYPNTKFLRWEIKELIEELKQADYTGE